MAFVNRVKNFFNGQGYVEDDEEDEEDDEYDEDEEDEEDDNPDGFGSDDDNPDGYGNDDELNKKLAGEDEEDEEDDKGDDEDDEGGKKKKKGKKDKDKDDKQEKEKKQKIKLKNAPPDRGEMNDLARQLKAEKTFFPRTCPFCKQRSIYLEPVGPMLKRTTIQFILSVITRGAVNTRKLRYVCLNKNCKAFYMKVHTRFIDSPTIGGALIPSHFLDTPANPWRLKL